MLRPRFAFGAFLVGVTLLGLTGARPAQRTSRGRSMTSDSVTVRVMFKASGSELEQCTGLNWGWDSLTWRLRPGETIPHAFIFVRPEFKIGQRSSADSTWLIVEPGRLTVADSSLVTSQWTPIFTTVGIKDAQMWFRVRLVDSWPEPLRKPMRTTTLRGKIVDDSTGCAVFFCQVIVVGTKLTARSDTLGRFAISDVPVGEVGVDACAGGYVWNHMEVRAPADSLLIRLRRHPGARFSAPCR